MSSWLDIASSDRFENVNGYLDLKAEAKSAPLSPSTKTTIGMLDSQGVLAVSGPDASKFLQGQCTADIEKLEIGMSTPGAICTTKGRVICTFQALKLADTVLLRMSADLIEDVKEKIQKYAAFFKVEMSCWGAPSVIAISGELTLGNPLPEGVYLSIIGENDAELYVEPGKAELAHSLFESAEFVSESDWYAARVRAGQAEINLCTSEQFLPHQINLDRSGAVNFTKGCYTGQEIVARMEYRGKTKRRMRPVMLATEIADTHNIELRLNAEDSSPVEILSAALRTDGRTLISLLLPIDQSNKGVFMLEGQEIDYKLLDLPYLLED